MSPALIITLAIQFGCQLFKVVYYSLRNGRLEAFRLVAAGGMPSAHSAFVAALIVSVGLVEGWDSGAFTVAVVLAAIVVFDTLRLRRTVDHHTRVLRELATLLPVERRQFRSAPVGHNGLEVAVGLAVGSGLTLVAFELFVA